jgi:transposase
MRCEELLERWEAGRSSRGEAAAALGVSERTFRRWRTRQVDEGEDGLVDRLVGRASPRRAPEEELALMPGLYHDHDRGFTARHFHDRLRQRRGYQFGYPTTRLCLQKSGAVAPAPRPGAHRRQRPRRPLAGMLVHRDRSRHGWLAGLPPRDLVITLDDATSELCSACLVAEEGTASSFRGLAEVIARHGLFIESTPTAAATVS